MNNVSVISAVVSVSGAVLTAVLGGVFEARRRRSDREQLRRDLVSRYRDPLLQSAASLAARLRNAIRLLSGEEVHQAAPGSERQDEYNRYDSLYRLAAYLGWVQILQQEAHFLDLGSRRRNRRLMRRLGEVKGALSGHIEPSDTRVFLLLGGEQQAIGELMIDPDSPDRPRCLGYVQFRRRYRDDAEFAGWFEPLLEETTKVLEHPEEGAARLTTVYNALVDLIVYLDPKKVWILGPNRKFEHALTTASPDATPTK
ncbi:hypothetical protein [Amycolatopsis keratiniphila]|uniref:Uncharacterized protein n=1 Tax=Amycolatopsis keratiniphila subsp. keratiniphila TaxID=227715 RepID=A0A1W2LNK7_9PSEU|nr:hypothetical protein [Amycolatopsis keratiniphila]OLZ44444.1 hypothetical protein BS330_40370 [Amycolatopsis keratiniphila subsp. nogabecina]ONF64725.1 hypothetical protein AVR91_0229090 [Amycolatopsis keratiniphila subsp. keratiniphila]SDU46771.1 hypothetical protein SAMN04489733_4650 [Amycolatopsis keratiniphila]